GCFRIVGDNTLGGVSKRGLRHFQTSPKSDGFVFPSGRGGYGLLGRSIEVFRPTPQLPGSSARSRTGNNYGSLRRRRANAALSRAQTPASGPPNALPILAGWAGE